MVNSMKWLFFWCSCCIFSATASENPRRQVHFNPQLSVREFKKKNPVNGEFQRLQVPMPVERDLHFDTSYPMSVFFEAAKFNQFITEDESELDQVSQRLKKSSPELKPRLG